MTFEEWWKEYQKDYDPFDWDENKVKDAWNAAIEAAQNKLTEKDYYRCTNPFDDFYVTTYPDEDIAVLLTTSS